MQIEHEKCLEIMFHCNAQFEPILVPRASRTGGLTHLKKKKRQKREKKRRKKGKRIRKKGKKRGKKRNIYLLVLLKKDNFIFFAHQFSSIIIPAQEDA